MEKSHHCMGARRICIFENMRSYIQIIILIWSSACIEPSIMQTLNWELATESLDSEGNIQFGNNIQLICTVQGSPCCSSLTRVWNKISGGVNTQIINNGATNFPDKYSELIDAANNQFSLIIKNLDKDDVDITYYCSYLNDSPQKILTQNDSFIAIPRSSCPMDIKKGTLQGHLSESELTPMPSVTASFGADSFTSDLTITAVAGYPKFYSLTSSLKNETSCKCRCGEKFTLSVTTGSVVTNVCDKEDLCKCGQCAGKDFGYACLGTTVGSIIIVAAAGIKGLDMLQKVKCGLLTFFISLVLDVIIAVPIGFELCHCVIDGADPAFIVLGLVSSIIIGVIVLILLRDIQIISGEIGSDVTLPCDFSISDDQSIEWGHIASDGSFVIYTNNGKVDGQLPQETAERLKLAGDNLEISSLMENDGGRYICKVIGTNKKTELQLNVKD